MSDPVLFFQSACKSFGNEVALDKLTLRIEGGTTYCLLGVNGAGKSTTLRLLLNRIKLSSGLIRVFGKASESLSSDDFCRIGYVSEGQKLYDWMTLEQIVSSTKPLYPMWDDQLCQSLIKRYKLQIGRKLKRMSRGMRMKVKLVLALSYHPELLIMDEPLSGLDPIVKQECIESLNQWKAENDKRTLVISSHDIDDVEPICDSVGILHEGRLILNETLTEVLERTKRIRIWDVDESEIQRLEGMYSRVDCGDNFVDILATDFAVSDISGKLADICPNSSKVELFGLSLREAFVAYVLEYEGREEGGVVS